MYLKDRDVDHLATSSTILNFTLPKTILTTVGSVGCDISNLALMTHPILSPYTHLSSSPSTLDSSPHYTKQLSRDSTLTKKKIDSSYFIQFVYIYIYIYIYILLLFVFYTLCCETHMFFSFFLYNWCYCRTSCASHIRSGGGALVAERRNFKLLFSAGIVLPLGFSIYIFRPMRMIHAILPGWLPRAI